ncbi:lysine--tRNA ligase [Candidatus Woesearchaeota archaeon]|nr:lysine--tRNA ligase [Candidatus Woesearchaeota archaeon]
MSNEKMFWADQIVQELKKRIETDPKLKSIYKKQGLLVYDEKTPSGHIHVGSGRGWIIHDVIAKSCRDIGLNAKFALASDDIDPYDKPNKDLPKSFDKYIGIPFMNIPSPVKGYKSFADYYFRQAVDKFKEIGIEADIESTGENYQTGVFNKAIKIILDNADKVKAVFERIYDKPYDKLPFNPICDKCGKIATTFADKWDSKKELVYYTCKKDLVAWVEGCGHTAWTSPYNGGGKLPWKVEWAAKWFSKGVICEFAGKDHFTKGGSRDVANAISLEILDFPPPYPSTKNYIGKAYEFFTIGGKKMSTSKGAGVSFADAVDNLSPQILRYLLVRTRPWAVIDFNPKGTNDLILLFDRYDRTERIFFDMEEVDDREVINNKRIYELSHIGKIPKKMPAQIPLIHAATVMQIGGDVSSAIKILEDSQYIKTLTKEDKEIVEQRLADAKKWTLNFADEQHKFELNKDAKGIKLSQNQKKALKDIAKALKKKISEKELHQKIYDTARENNLETKEVFTAAYKALINKEKGPRLASFILTIGKEKAIKLFES